MRHQEPASGKPAGFLCTLFHQAREAVRRGTALPGEPEPRVPDPIPPHFDPHPSAPRSAPSTLPPPTLRHIRRQDLADTSRLLALYTQALTAGLIGRSEAERLSFVGLAQHVLTYGPANAGGLFRRLLVRRHFHFITPAEEEAALQRLKYHLYGGELAVCASRTGWGPQGAAQKVAGDDA